MCSKNCPCANVPARSNWENLNPLTVKADRQIDCYAWDFSGTVTTYKECITDFNKRGVLADLDF